jgi:hypothetical protein
MHHRTKEEAPEASIQQLANASHEFVETLLTLKGNFTELQNRHVRGNPQLAHSQGISQERGSNLANFDLFVSEHCANSAKQEL